MSGFRSLPTSPADVRRHHQDTYQRLIDSGSYRPFVWPYNVTGPYLLIAYLLLPPTNSRFVFYLRYPVFGLITYLSVESIRDCRSHWLAFGYLVGLLGAWAVLWSATLLIFRDCRAEARRIESRPRLSGGETSERSKSDQEGSSSSSSYGSGNAAKNRALRERVSEKKAPDPPPSSEGDGDHSEEKTVDEFVWQSLPKNFAHRFDWVLDLGSSFRGPRWATQIAGLPSPPSYIQAELKDPSLRSPTAESNWSRQDLLRHYLSRLIIFYIIQDVLKTIAMQDPYFWSLPADTSSPFPWPRTSRTVLSLVFTYFALHMIFVLLPLVSGVLLGPERIGGHAWPWLYPPYFGSLAEVSQRGLAGAWSRWWQQLFRFAFDQAGEFAASVLGWEKTTLRGVMLRVNVAFWCSGALHASASYTTVSSTKPWKSFLFFAIQPFGIFVQRALSEWLKRNGWRDRIPPKIRQVGNILAVTAWFSVTGPLIADEFAACGIWLFEPVPISIVRGLRGEGWWRWNGSWMKWYSDKDWWRSGIAI